MATETAESMAKTLELLANDLRKGRNIGDVISELEDTIQEWSEAFDVTMFDDDEEYDPN